ncbi:hypothetical protein [Agromyces atrinae]|uniref:Uncharacterized protein n=1 Tax=Agromyces atrinae TaxID=592376 RepID=A0A4Q2M8H6_9MICO|nr:hypothetical protein [Agromyces atrinae]NYD67437.1 hypothetical protein [Agromyces atrinae]RXZ88338.1 hypothetical protein ESP50_03960 [Agromyces atrinae]
MDPRRTLIALAVCLALAGCSGPSEPTTTSSESAAPAADAAERLFRLHVDHDPIASTTQLAALSDIVVRGTVAGITDGAVDGGPDDASFVIPISVVEIAVAETIKGASSGTVYFADFVGPEIMRDALPIGTDVALYGYLFLEETPDGVIARAHASAGRPPGEPLYREAHPQGFVIELDGTLVWPFTSVTARGTLADALPGGPLTGSER